MPTQTYYFTGEALFPHLSKPDTKYDAAGIWHIGVILDEASKVQYAASGMQVRPKDYQGKQYVRFSRPKQKLIKNELVQFGPPEVINPDGSPVTVLVGNGSRVTIKAIVYDTMKGKGHRMEMVRVDELVEYKPEPKPDAPAAPTTATAKTSIPF